MVSFLHTKLYNNTKYQHMNIHTQHTYNIHNIHNIDSIHNIQHTYIDNAKYKFDIHTSQTF